MQGSTVGALPEVAKYLKGLKQMNPVQKQITPPWDLHSVLLSLSRPPFEPMSSAALKYVTWKTAFLLAITSCRRVSELQALSSKEPFTSIRGDFASLRTVPSFLPKCASAWHLNQSIELRAFHPRPNPQDKVDVGLSKQCPVRALRLYLQ